MHIPWQNATLCATCPKTHDRVCWRPIPPSTAATATTPLIPVLPINSRILIKSCLNCKNPKIGKHYKTNHSKTYTTIMKYYNLWIKTINIDNYSNYCNISLPQTNIKTLLLNFSIEDTIFAKLEQFTHIQKSYTYEKIWPEVWHTLSNNWERQKKNKLQHISIITIIIRKYNILNCKYYKTNHSKTYTTIMKYYNVCIKTIHINNYSNFCNISLPQTNIKKHYY